MKKNKYHKKDKRDKKIKKESNEKTFSGVLSITKYGYGFVDIEKHEGIYVSQKNMNGAFMGDTVRAKLIKTGRRPECKIIEIVKRDISTLVGTYQRQGNQSYFVPFNNKIPFVFKIKHFNPDITFMLSDGDVVVADILSYGTKEKVPTVYVREFLGKYDDFGNDMLVVMRKYNVFAEFPEEVLKDESTNKKITEDELSKRLDLTNEIIVTIDGDDAKDLDDAISVKKEKNGYTLGVHIADVSHYVKSGSSTDNEAYKRGTSVYLPDRVAPMLPFRLSNDLCSLNPNEIKLTFSCIIKIDNNGNVTDYELRKSYIKSSARLTYNIVKKIVMGDFSEETEPFLPFKENILLMHELYCLMRKKREKERFVEFNFPEPYFEIDENGKVKDIYAYPISFANEMIEEFMLCANVCVADFAMENNFPFIYRVHTEPDSKKIHFLYKVLDSYGIKHTMSQKPTPEEFDDILLNAENSDFKTAVHQIALRSMQKAQYSQKPLGHYGLNFKKYCHFTSPIRRYPDLMIHRILSDFLDGKSLKRYNKIVGNIAEQSSDREVNAFVCEREANDIKKAEFMENYLGEKYEGFVSGMCENGFFVQLENTVEGFVPLATIKGDYYKYFEDEFTIRGKRYKNKFVMGQKVSVIVDKCDVINGKVDFYLA